MFCKKCGCELAEGTKFCRKCGAPVTETKSAYTATEAYDKLSAGAQNAGKAIGNATTRVADGAKEKISAMPKKKLFLYGGIALAVIALIVVAVIISNNAKHTLNLEKYVQIEYEGYESVGTAKVQLDRDKIQRDFKDIFKTSGKASSKSSYKFNKKDFYPDDYDDLDDLYDMAKEYAEGYDYDDYDDDDDEVYEFINDCIQYTVSKDSGLSNGDEIIVKFKYNEVKAEEKYGIKLKGEEYKAIVSGLEEVRILAPLDDVAVEFTGISPNGRAEVPNYYVEAEGHEFYVECRPRDGLKNGDKVTVSISGGVDNVQLAENYGFIVAETEKVLTVSGLGEYVQTIDSIPDAMLDDMKSQGTDYLVAYAAKRWDSKVTLNGLNYKGCYLLTRKQDSWGNNNILYLLFSANVSYDNVSDNVDAHYSYDYYTYVAYRDVVVNPDGSYQVDYNNCDTAGSNCRHEFVYTDGRYDRTDSYYFNGYESMDTMYTDCITKNIDVYAHEEKLEDGSLTADVTAENDGDDDSEEEKVFEPWDIDIDAEYKAIKDECKARDDNLGNYKFYDFGDFSCYAMDGTPVVINVKAGYDGWEYGRVYYGAAPYYAKLTKTGESLELTFCEGRLMRYVDENGRAHDYNCEGWAEYDDIGEKTAADEEKIRDIIESQI